MWRALHPEGITAVPSADSYWGEVTLLGLPVGSTDGILDHIFTQGHSEKCDCPRLADHWKTEIPHTCSDHWFTSYLAERLSTASRKAKEEDEPVAAFRHCSLPSSSSALAQICISCSTNKSGCAYTHHLEQRQQTLSLCLISATVFGRELNYLWSVSRTLLIHPPSTHANGSPIPT